MKKVIKKNKDFCVIAANIRSLYNIGSIFRTCDAVGVKKLFLTGYSGNPDKDEKIKKTSLGAEKTVDWEKKWHTWQIVEQLQNQHIKVIALEKTSQSIDYRKWQPDFPLAIVLGNEIRGLSDKILKRCDQVVHLPMLGIKESLNVSVSLGAIAYHILAS